MDLAGTRGARLDQDFRARGLPALKMMHAFVGGGRQNGDGRHEGTRSGFAARIEEGDHVRRSRLEGSDRITGGHCSV